MDPRATGDTDDFLRSALRDSLILFGGLVAALLSTKSRRGPQQGDERMVDVTGFHIRRFAGDRGRYVESNRI